MTKNIILMEIETNPNIGLFIFANDKFAICGKNINSSQIEEIKKTLEVPVYQMTILGTDLIGVFLAGNNEKIIIPKIYSFELEELNKITKEHEIELIEIEDKVNSFGNVITLTNDSIIAGNLINKSLKEKLEKKTKLKILNLENKEFNGAGSVFIFANNKLFASQVLNQEDVKDFEDKISSVGSINSGSAFIASGTVANKNGIIIGSSSSTIEIQHIVETLEYI